ncbi:MAG: imidazolonepropionase [Firmicutes bacterium]|nr:imidazolonepropionase [Bacillota bacterium]
MADVAHTLIDHIGLLWTMVEPGEDLTRPRRGQEAMRSVGAIRDAAIALDASGVVLAVGPARDVRQWADRTTLHLDAAGGFVCPGFVDPHTHLVHGGQRAHEVPLRLAGASYLEILEQGGGILSTMKATATATEAALLSQARTSALRLLKSGVTTVEAKTGYGMALCVERKQLQVAKELAATGVQTVIHTALPAHAVPQERRHDREAFVAEIIAMLPALHVEGAEFVDVFIEQGVFSVDEGRAILLAGQACGMKLKMHADEIVSCGGAELAAQLGAVSADHLLAASDAGLIAMAHAGVVAVCLPGTSFYLQKVPARARFMIDEAQLAVAIASDYNPGSAPSENFGLTMSLALLTLRMTPEEVFVAATRNAACAVARGDQAGALAIGRRGDFVVFGVEDPAYILSHFGINHVRAVFAGGRCVSGALA